MCTSVDERGRQAVEISNRIDPSSHREHYGRGAGTVKTIIGKGFMVTFLEGHLYADGAHADQRRQV